MNAVALSPGVAAALDRCAGGRRLEREDGVALIRATEAELPAVLGAAADVRDRGKGRTVTYSRKVFLPLTNLCRDDCGYCTFKRDPGQPGARTMEMNGRRYEGYIRVDPERCDGPALRHWLSLAEKYVATLPPKKRRE